ncbi:MAG TPA: hypothetical protein VNM69_05510 [Bacillus sp. (in: firmicutes)]|uniref:hypothetical protein n=1 Tax=Bacillus litorisediminis TaxID=2922713 RepID=UPI001FADDED5|nr:hypothetical protein [Bacillus litorisediminis]HWO75364.1 hypothetical protein [Bacillus sp. (in: firmicutes)]
MSQCDIPICNILARFRGFNVRITLEDGTVVTGELLGVSNCVVGVLQPDTVSPFTGPELALIPCTEIRFAVVEGVPPGVGFDFDNGNDDESPESS